MWWQHSDYDKKKQFWFDTCERTDKYPAEPLFSFFFCFFFSGLSCTDPCLYKSVHFCLHVLSFNNSCLQVIILLLTVVLYFLVEVCSCTPLYSLLRTRESKPDMPITNRQLQPFTMNCLHDQWFLKLQLKTSTFLTCNCVVSAISCKNILKCATMNHLHAGLYYHHATSTTYIIKM